MFAIWIVLKLSFRLYLVSYIQVTDILQILYSNNQT